MHFLLLLTLSLPLIAAPNLQTLFRSLDSLSIAENLAFHELYPDSPEGKEALKRAVTILFGNEHASNISIPKLDINSIVSLVSKQIPNTPVYLSLEQLEVLNKIGENFPNRKLKGYHAWSQQEVLELPSEEIDLGRALFICQFEKSPEMRREILQYETTLDLMALQILQRLPLNSSHEQKIKQINHFVFQEMRFRFPPHSIYAKDVDLYTFLPSVLDGRQGVCLGVCILYLALAQRLDLPLEIITPPGHIYLRYPSPEGMINIETTARGIHLPSEVYLGVGTRYLEKKTLKEVIGWSFMNQASISFGNSDYLKTVEIYEKALPYLPNDPLLNMFLGLNYLFIGKKKEGTSLLSKMNPLLPHAVSKETIPEDFLRKAVDIEGLKVIFSRVDETRESILNKQKELEKVVKKHPKFRAGLMQLAVTYLQLGKAKKALELLIRYHKIDPTDATVEYYLSALFFERLDIIKAWEHLREAETLTSARDHFPKALISLRNQMRQQCPDPAFEHVSIQSTPKEDLSLTINSKHGEFLIFSDGSKWQISPADREISSLWLTAFRLKIEKDPAASEYPYLIENLDTNQKVHAKKVSTDSDPIL